MGKRNPYSDRGAGGGGCDDGWDWSAGAGSSSPIEIGQVRKSLKTNDKVYLTSSSLSFSAAGAVVFGVHGVFVEAFLWESSPFLALASFLAIQHTFACRGTQDQTAVVVQPIDKREPRKEIVSTTEKKKIPK